MVPLLGLLVAHEAAAVPFGMCKPAGNDAPCVCSLASVELPLSFAEAAGLIEIYARAELDEGLERLLGGMLRQCALDPSARPRGPAATLAIETRHPRASR